MIPFSLRIDEEICRLWREIQDGTYEISTTKAFMVNDRKKREIFAMQPRDKIVNHWVKMRIEPLMEQEFSEGCYSCRKGKGLTAFARDAERHIKMLTNDFSRPCYFAHLDIRSFFLSIKRTRALEKTLAVAEKYQGEDKETLKWLISKILLFAPEKNYYISGNPNDWKGYPAEKSLLTNRAGCGLMLGSVNSQFVANLYLTDTDRFIASLGIVWLRYVDDILLICEDRARLLSSIPKIERFLNEDTGLEIHFHKRYFQDSFKGVNIVGYTFKGERTYLSKRCVGNAMKRVSGFGRRDTDRLVACVNSYLGRSLDCRAYNQRAKIIGAIPSVCWIGIYARENLRKIQKRKNSVTFARYDIARLI